MKIRKLAAAIVSAILLLIATATAAEEIDIHRSVSMTIVFRENGAGLPNAQFDIHKIASLDPSGTPTMLPPFANYNVNLDDMSESSLARMAVTLEGYVLRDRIEPAMRCTTDNAGTAVLPGNNGSMSPGLYLITGERYVHNGMVYTIQPTVVCLPLWDAVHNRWRYDVTIHIKSESHPDTPDRPKITRKVLKIWEQDGSETELPREVVIQLLRDGEVFDTVSLNAENLWRHTWLELEPDHHWTVVEQTIPDYDVVITQEGITFVVTNIYSPENPPIDPTPTPDPSDSPDDPLPTAKPKPTPPPDTPKLPQTGQLWWPVPMLVCAGLLLIVIGLLLCRR